MTVRVIPASEETNAQYHASGAWGSTTLGVSIKNPRLAHMMVSAKYRPPETAAMRFGSRFHALLDPGSKFAVRHRCGPDADRRTKIWTSAEAEALAVGIELVPVEEWEALHAMAASVRANPIAASLLEGAAHEIGFRMPAPHGPFQVQCRADLYHARTHLVDFKTTGDVDAFASSVVTYAYHRQAALYRWIVSHACGGELLPFSFVVVEKAAPLYRCRVVDLDAEFLEIGWREVDTALAEIARRTASNNWEDGHYADVVSTPNWLLNAQRTNAA